MMTQPQQLNKVKKMDKGTCTIMQPYADREGYQEVEITKNFWKCMTCGRVWAMRGEAQGCKHRDFYQRTYGGYIDLRLGRVGGTTYTMWMIRKEVM